MQKIKVAFSINQEVKTRTLPEKIMIIVGYEYIDQRGVRYVCLDGTEYRYLNQCDIIAADDQKTSIGFLVSSSKK